MFNVPLNRALQNRNGMELIGSKNVYTSRLKITRSCSLAISRRVAAAV